jgi:hypothetical protein
MLATYFYQANASITSDEENTEFVRKGDLGIQLLPIPSRKIWGE